MKRSIFVYCSFVILFISVICSCHENNMQPHFSFVSNDVILPDSFLLCWGNTMEGDSVFFYQYENLPILKNVSDVKVDNFLLCIDITGVNDTSEISRYYFIDEISRDEAGDLTVTVHYGTHIVFPHEEIPFPITSISSKDENCVFVLKYKWGLVPIKNSNYCNMLGIVYHQKSDYPEIVVSNPQKSFIYASESILGVDRLANSVLVFKDTIISHINNIELLKEKEIGKLTEIQ